MNIFTIAQLANNNTGTYYDTNSGAIKYSLMPELTMLGHDKYDISLTPGKTNKIVKNNEKPVIKQPTKQPIKEPKKIRKVKTFSDEQRCCANKLDGTRCSLKRYEKSGELCYVHYTQLLPKTEIPTSEKTPDNNNSKSKKWFSFLKFW